MHAAELCATKFQVQKDVCEFNSSSPVWPALCVAASRHLKMRSRRLRASLRGGGNFFHVGEHFGIVHLLANLLEEWMHLGEDEEHLAATAGLQKEFSLSAP